MITIMSDYTLAEWFVLSLMVYGTGFFIAGALRVLWVVSMMALSAAECVYRGRS